MKFDLKFLGLGGCFNVNLGNTSAFFKDKFNNLFLIDCGCDVFSKLIRHKVLDDVNNVYAFITHLHDDHVGSLMSLVFYVKFVLNKKITVLHPAYDMLRLMSLQGALRHGQVLIARCDTICNENSKDKILNYEFTETKHVNEIKSFSLIIRNKTTPQVIYYSGDTITLINGNINFHLDQEIGSEIEIYQDVNMETSNKANVHMDIATLSNLVPPRNRDRINCIHLGNYDPNILIEKGFKVPEIYNP